MKKKKFRKPSKISESTKFPESAESVTSFESPKLKWFDRILGSLAMVISILALWISIETCSSSEEQFLELNQGRIAVEADCILEHRLSPKQKDELTQFQIDTVGISGIVYQLAIQNVGNLPIKFKVTSFQVFQEGKMVLDAAGNYTQIYELYPHSKEATFTSGVAFPFERTPIAELRNRDIRVKYAVDYWDLGIDDVGIDDIRKAEGQYRLILRSPYSIDIQPVRNP
jgi:hypothetical protein